MPIHLENAASAPPSGVFLSYSRKDRGFVTLYRLALRTGGVRVWQDQVSIAPGEAWRLKIAEGIDGCERMLVFWCRHSSNSAEVEREYRMAIARAKTIVPLMLDGTRLPPALEGINGEDLRRYTWWNHELRKLGTPAWWMGLAIIAAYWLGTRS